MMTCFMCCSRLCAIRCGRRGGHCYYEQGSPFLSHASSQCPTGRRPIVSHTPDLVGSREESLPPDTWTESGQTPALTESSSSRDRLLWSGDWVGVGSGTPNDPTTTSSCPQHLSRARPIAVTTYAPRSSTSSVRRGRQ